MNCVLPTKISAGLSFSQSLRFDSYQAPAWSLTLLLRGPASIDLPAVADGSNHRLQATGGVTETWAPGLYNFAIRATNGVDLVELQRGQIEIAPDMASLPVGADVRTPSQIALEAIEAVIQKRASIDQERYRINNRELYRTPIKDLIALRDMYRGEVRREQMAACGKKLWGGTVRVRLQ